MAPLTINVPEGIADVLAPLTCINADEHTVRSILRDDIYEAADALGHIAEDSEDPCPVALRSIAARLGVLADAYEETS